MTYIPIPTPDDVKAALEAAARRPRAAAVPGLDLLKEHPCFGGSQRFYRHASSEIGLPMQFSVYLPPAALADPTRPVPTLMYLAGLTCTEETFMVKAGAQRYAAEHGIALVSPDTSPRGTEAESIEGATADWDFGIGAGFYLDATEAPWNRHWRMESYIVRELVPLLGRLLPIDTARLGLMGHSMGGHGALTLAQRHPGVFRSLSAIAPICAASQCAWGDKAFRNYFGVVCRTWQAHDATVLMQKQKSAPYPGGILIDQGMADAFLAEQLHPHVFEAACGLVRQPLTVRRHAEYDHGYYFIQTVIGDHVAHHARQLV
ncbi:S-formylglutathione hydrolase [Paracidovorax konjaci]|uniref:S-formylglutathione hydrolase n=1 Tax=Paracidovorax konjaci TaxID=32040 RepID=A0A1I1TID7_9BURK|nr:S-formylglutathione hydrolase [Paracidovorax konjaci]SFD58295.1 S-formylglutathione hydrolase [Paracidovorax konjaci]